MSNTETKLTGLMLHRHVIAITTAALAGGRAVLMDIAEGAPDCRARRAGYPLCAGVTGCGVMQNKSKQDAVDAIIREIKQSLYSASKASNSNITRQHYKGSSKSDRLSRQRGKVYFFFCDASGLVKIGWTKWLGRRRSQLMRKHGHLQLLGWMPGGTSLEASLHRHFKATRVTGEWFRFDDNLRDFIVNFTVIEPYPPYMTMSKAERDKSFREAREIK